jgi:two-component system OmpR family sensor kinase
MPHLHAMQPVEAGPTPQVALFDPQGKALPLSDPDLAIPAVAGLPSGVSTLTIGEHPWRLYRQTLRVQGATYALIVGQDLSPLERAERQQWYLLTGWLIAGLAGSAALGLWLADRSARPIRELADQARRIGPDAISERLPVPDSSDEMAVLADSLNRMLTRLEQAFAAQSRFVHDAAHEVRTPLAALRTSLEVTIRRQREPADYEEAIRDALAEIDRLTRLVNQLLTLERSGEGLVTGATPMAPLLQGALQRFQDMAAERGVHLAGQGDGCVIADPSRLEQVLDNLLSNAIRYSPAGGTVTLDVQDSGTKTVIRVIDEGPGIPADQQQAVFERFFRVDPSRHHSTGGAGLGLAICRAIVEGHGGTISIEPSAIGTVVRIEWPTAVSPVA